MTMKEFEAIKGDFRSHRPKGSTAGSIVHVKEVPLSSTLDTDRGTVSLTPGDVVVKSTDGRDVAVLPRGLALELLQPVGGERVESAGDKWTAVERVKRWPEEKRREYEAIEDPNAKHRFFQETELAVSHAERQAAAGEALKRGAGVRL